MAAVLAAGLAQPAGAVDLGASVDAEVNLGSGGVSADADVDIGGSGSGSRSGGGTADADVNVGIGGSGSGDGSGSGTGGSGSGGSTIDADVNVGGGGSGSGSGSGSGGGSGSESGSDSASGGTSGEDDAENAGAAGGDLATRARTGDGAILDGSLQALLAALPGKQVYSSDNRLIGHVDRVAQNGGRPFMVIRVLSDHGLGTSTVMMPADSGEMRGDILHLSMSLGRFVHLAGQA